MERLQLTDGIEVDVVRPGELGKTEQALWTGLNARSGRRRSPYFSYAYAHASDGIVPRARVAVLHRRGEIVGFLPFQSRGAKLQPLAAPLTDYHGVIGGSETNFDVPRIGRMLGASVFFFNGLGLDEHLPDHPMVARPTMTADVSGGLDAYLTSKPGARKFIKTKERVGRNFERTHGPLSFRADDDDPAVFGFVVARKREQYRATGLHDIFACGWTEAFLRRLWEERRTEFGARISSLRAGDRVVAAALDLRGDGVHHIWFPAYDADYARFGPGVQLMHRLLRAAADDPRVTMVDFGKQDLRYKAIYADPTHPLLEGQMLMGSLASAWSRRADAVLGGAPGFKPIRETRERLRRRFDVITACETNPAAWMGGALTAFRRAALRRSAAPLA